MILIYKTTETPSLLIMLKPGINNASQRLYGVGRALVQLYPDLLIPVRTSIAAPTVLATINQNKRNKRNPIMTDFIIPYFKEGVIMALSAAVGGFITMATMGVTLKYMAADIEELRSAVKELKSDLKTYDDLQRELVILKSEYTRVSIRVDQLDWLRNPLVREEIMQLIKTHTSHRIEKHHKQLN